MWNIPDFKIFSIVIFRSTLGKTNFSTKTLMWTKFPELQWFLNGFTAFFCTNVKRLPPENFFFKRIASLGRESTLAYIFWTHGNWTREKIEGNCKVNKMSRMSILSLLWFFVFFLSPCQLDYKKKVKLSTKTVMRRKCPECLYFVVNVFLNASQMEHKKEHNFLELKEQKWKTELNWKVATPIIMLLSVCILFLIVS